MRTQEVGLSQRPRVRIAIFIGLCWLYACIHLDRQILSILAQSVKSDLGVQDEQLGALTGTAFATVYALLGLYFGRIADRTDRLVLVRTGAWVWSASCIAAGCAPGFAWLIASRGGMALGEAIASAAAVSLIAELAGERHRARGASIFVAGAFVGAGAAVVLGGVILGHFGPPPNGEGWRVAMMVAAAPSIAGAIYLGRFRLPAAVRDLPQNAGMGRGLPFGLVGASACTIVVQMSLPPAWSVPSSTALALAVAGGWARHLEGADPAAYRATLGKRSFRWLLLSFAAVLFIDFAASFWLIPYALRSFDLTPAAGGAQLGVLMIAGGVAGTLLGGLAADRWRRVDRSGRVWTALVAVLLETTAILTAVAQTHYGPFLAAFAAFCVLSGGWTGVVAALAMDIVPAGHRGTGTAAYFLLTTLLGPGLGPFVVGLGSEVFGSLGGALAWGCAASVIAAVGLVRLGRLLASAAPT